MILPGWIVELWTIFSSFFYTYRYVARRPVRSRLLAVRAERIAAERSGGGGGGCTTDDDVMSELGAAAGRVAGKFCPRSERRQQLERQRQRRAEELIRTKNLSLDAGATAGAAASATANRRSAAEPEQHPAHRQPGPAAALGEAAATANSAASPGRNVFTKKGGSGGGMTNSPSCGEFQYSRQPIEALAAAAARRQQEPIGASGPVADTNKRYSYHEESYSHVPNDILVSVMTV
jgi:hypothetical protein